MERKPENTKRSLFGDGLWGKIFVQGTMIGTLTLLCFTIGNKFYNLEVGRTMAFVSLSMLELIHSFNIKSDESIFKAGIFNNWYLIGAFLLGTILQIGVVTIPSISKIFGCQPLNYIQWTIVAIISIFSIIIVEAQKAINEIRFGKRIYGMRHNF